MPSGTAGKAGQQSQTPAGTVQHSKVKIPGTGEEEQGSGHTPTVVSEGAVVAVLTWLKLCACLRAVWGKKWCSHKEFFPHIEF